MITQSQSPSSTPETTNHHFDFLLLDGFSSLSLMAAIETLQNANLVSGKELYSWRTIGVEAQDVRSSVGLLQKTDGPLSKVAVGNDMVLVAGDVAYNADISRFSIWLARHVRAGVRVTALGTAAIILARAGLLKNHDVAIHPWYRVGLAERFSQTGLSSRTHISAGQRCSASGGTSSIDLFLDFIEQDHGSTFVNLVADSMCYRQTRLLQASLDLSKPNSSTVLHPVLSKAISLMEKNLEFPQSPSTLAADLNISTRQLERLFKKYIGLSPKRFNMRIRLQEAYRLLIQTHFEITEIALMTGFSSSSHFSKCFRAEFQTTPHKLQTQRNDLEAVRSSPST